MTRSVFNNFTYDAHGNLTGYTANYGTNHPLNGTYSFTYDDKDQLIRETSTRQGAPTYDYTYDAAGNPTEFRSVALDEANEDNQDPNNIYDGNGNPTTYHGETLTYDSQNHLLAKDGVTFGYDADGRRAWKQVGDVRTWFVYAGTNPVCEVQLIDGHTVITALNVFSNGELVSRTEYNASGGQTTLYQCDRLGNVGHRLDDDGNLLTTQLYDAYGNELAAYDAQDNALQLGSIPDPYGYKGSVGYYTDHETGLILCTARYYDAEGGRWLTRDPIGYRDSYNLYVYCNNNPISCVDSIGTDPLSLFGWFEFDGEISDVIAGWVDEGWELNFYVMNGYYPSLWVYRDLFMALNPRKWILSDVLGISVNEDSTSYEAGKALGQLIPMLIPGGQSTKVSKVPIPSAGRAGWRTRCVFTDIVESLLSLKTKVSNVSKGLRARYVEEVLSLTKLRDVMRAAGFDSELIARTLAAWRREIGIKYKLMWSKEQQAIMFEINLKRYGDKWGLTIKFVRDIKGKSWEEIIESSCRPGGGDIVPPELQ